MNIFIDCREYYLLFLFKSFGEKSFSSDFLENIPRRIYQGQHYSIRVKGSKNSLQLL
jgi:hypothetical protein